MTDIKYWYWDRPLEKLFLWFIWKIPPKICLWCFVRVCSRGDNPNVTYEQAYKLWVKEYPHVR